MQRAGGRKITYSITQGLFDPVDLSGRATYHAVAQFILFLRDANSV